MKNDTKSAKKVMNFPPQNKSRHLCQSTYSGPLPGLVGHTEGLMALHTCEEEEIVQL